MDAMRTLLARHLTCGLAALLLSSLTACATDPAGEPPGTPGEEPGELGTVTAVVYQGGAPTADVPVAFHDATGAVIAVVTTGADGVASATVTAGAMITVPRERADGTRQLETMTGVAPGDTITFGLLPGDVSGNEAGRLRITGSPVQNTPSYTVDAGCRSSTVTALTPAPEIMVGSACVATPGVASVMVASLRQDGIPYSWAAATDVPVAPGTVGEATLSAWSADFVGMSVTTTALPDNALGVIGAAAAVHRDIPFRALAVENQVNAYPGGAATMILGYPRFGDGIDFKLQLVTGANETATGISVIVGREAGHPEQIVLDGGTSYLPVARVVTANTSSAAATAVTWQLAPGTVADAALVVVTGTQAAAGTRWTVMMRAEAGALTLPALPPELARFAPTSVTMTDVVLVDDDAVMGFDDARLEASLAILDRPLRGLTARVRYALERVAN